MPKWIQKRSDSDSTAPKAQQEPQWPWFINNKKTQISENSSFIYIGTTLNKMQTKLPDLWCGMEPACDMKNRGHQYIQNKKIIKIGGKRIKQPTKNFPDGATLRPSCSCIKMFWKL